MGTAALRGASRAPLGILDDVTTSPASRRLASARPALAPKCQLILARTLSSFITQQAQLPDVPRTVREQRGESKLAGTADTLLQVSQLLEFALHLRVRRAVEACFALEQVALGADRQFQGQLHETKHVGNHLRRKR